MKNVVITGSSRGIGYGLAREFLKNGHRVTLSGRNADTLSNAASSLLKETSNSSIDIAVCDVSKPADIKKLWQKAASHGNVDIWINNAGIGQGTRLIKDLELTQINDLINTNIWGLISCSKIALEQMLEQGSGSIYNMEGFGSDGRKRKGMAIYGSSKYALRYFTKSLAMEAASTNVLVGALSPGMVVTDLLIHPITEDTPINRQAIRIFNILADRVETVTPFLVKKILSNKKNDVQINWLTSKKVMGRFIKNIFIKRSVEGIPELN